MATKVKKAPAVDPLTALFQEWRAAVGTAVDAEELNDCESAIRELPESLQVERLQTALQRLGARS
jgi:hypothetical protein